MLEEFVCPIPPLSAPPHAPTPPPRKTPSPRAGTESERLIFPLSSRYPAQAAAWGGGSQWAWESAEKRRITGQRSDGTAGWPGTPPSPAGAAHSLRSAPGWGDPGRAPPARGSQLRRVPAPRPPQWVGVPAAQAAASRRPPAAPAARWPRPRRAPCAGPGGGAGRGHRGPLPRPRAPAVRGGSGGGGGAGTKVSGGDGSGRPPPREGAGGGARAPQRVGGGPGGAAGVACARARARVSRRLRGHGVGWGSGCPLGWGSSLSHPGLPGPRSSSLEVSLWTRPPAPTSPHSAGFSVSEFLSLWVGLCMSVQQLVQLSLS